MLFRPGLVVHGARAGQDLWSRARCTNEPHRVRNGVSCYLSFCEFKHFVEPFFAKN